MINIGEKYITIGDRVINSQEKVIGTVTRMESNNINNTPIYTVIADYDAITKVFGMDKPYQRRYTFPFGSIEPMQSMSMYSKKKDRYIRPSFELMPSKYIKKYNKVKIIDNDYLKNTLAKFTSVGINQCINTQTGVWTWFDSKYYSKFELNFYIMDLAAFGTDMVKCIYHTSSGQIESVCVPRNCLKLVKNYNFLTRFFIKRKIKKATN